MESQLSTLIKENLQLRKENKEMKDRMTILNRVIEEMLDQQDINRNSSQVLNERHCRHWEHQSRKGRERKYEGRDKEFYSTRNRFQQLADLSDDEFNTQDETVSYHHERSRSQNTSNFRKVQTRQERNNKVNLNYRTNAADIDKSTMNAKRILVIGDSQLYGIDQSKMSRTHAIKVKAQGGLKIEGLEDLLQQEIQHGPDEVIVHVGVNNLESSTDDEILSSFKSISDSFYDSTKLTFSSILRRSDKPELNGRIDYINGELEKMSLNRGHDYINNNNIRFSHLNRGGLHVNRLGQKQLAMNFIYQIKASG